MSVQLSLFNDQYCSGSPMFTEGLVLGGVNSSGNGQFNGQQINGISISNSGSNPASVNITWQSAYGNQDPAYLTVDPGQTVHYNVYLHAYNNNVTYLSWELDSC
jgi:hypothetical protein